MAELITRIANGFVAFDWLFLIMAAIVCALVMNKWTQLTAAALIAYTIDVAVRFMLQVWSAEGVPWNFATSLALARMDEHALAATIRPFFYFGAIALIYGIKRHYGRH